MSTNLENNPVYQMFNEVRKNLMSNLYQGHFHYEGAISILQNYIPLAQNMESNTFVGNIYNTLAVIELELGHYAQAEAYYQDAIAAYEDTQDATRMSIALCGLGELYRESSRMTEAVECYHRSRELAEAVDDERLIIYNYCNEGQLWLAENDFNQAIQLLEKGLTIVDAAEWDIEYHTKLMPEILSSLGEAYAKTGNFKIAQKQSERALDLARRESQVHQMAHAHQTLAIIAIQQQSSESDVVMHFAEAKQLWEKMGATADVGRLYMIEADYWNEQLNDTKRQTCLEAAINCFEVAGLDKELIAARDQLNELV